MDSAAASPGRCRRASGRSCASATRPTGGEPARAAGGPGAGVRQAQPGGAGRALGGDDGDRAEGRRPARRDARQQRPDRQLRGRQPELDAAVPRGVPAAARLRPAPLPPGGDGPRRGQHRDERAVPLGLSPHDLPTCSPTTTSAISASLPPARPPVLDRAVRQRLFDNLQVGGLADIPMGEFWVGRRRDGDDEAGGVGRPHLRPAAWSARRRSRRTSSRAAGWWNPYSIKALGDLVFCQGVNRFIFHRYAHQPWQGLLPGMTMGPWGTHFERTVTWWDQGAAWLRYVARCQYLLQSGPLRRRRLLLRRRGRPERPAGAQRPAPGAAGRLRLRRLRRRRAAEPDVGQGRPDRAARRDALPRAGAAREPVHDAAVLRKVADLVRAGATVVGPRADAVAQPVRLPAVR